MQLYLHWHFAEVNLLHLHYPKTQVTETDSCSPFCSEKLPKKTQWCKESDQQFLPLVKTFKSLELTFLEFP